MDCKLNRYDRIYVKLCGVDISARPIVFENLEPVKYETTCPSCGSLVVFDVGCDPVCCRKNVKKDNLTIKKSGQVIVDSFPVNNIECNVEVVNVCPFVDAVDEGLFNVSELYIR